MRAVHWFRNDLRLSDNTALSAAARADALIPLFVLDDALLAAHASPPRRRFLLDCLASLASNLAHRGSRLIVRRGAPAAVIERLLHETRADRLTFNRDYSPYARRRDAQVEARAARAGARVETYKDRVVFEHDELRTQAGTPFSVYTPYRNAWLARAGDALRARRAPTLPPLPAGVASEPLPTLTELGCADDARSSLAGGEAAALRRLATFLDGPLRAYARDRDRPGVDGTSRLSPYLRFGAISPRRCIADALARAAAEPGAAVGARKWVDELIWREFYLALLAAHPRLLGEAFKRDFQRVAWNDDADGFAAWCAGRTGFPIVDAAMRQLVATGWMHNRARMIVASFLTKDLLLDWRAGERFFMRHLIDGEPASNNGGWQWAASTGTDAQPYFRIFNPVLQGEKFDPDGTYVRGWVAELAAVPDRFLHKPWQAPTPPRDYPAPIVDHAERRITAVARYEAARRQAAVA
ncbi:MAG: deoxyribodipyrimidine photo-lyase [Deltaproteobacteria bacterium]|nr:deoxyribodipyrimidine photo-lyase [Deltaproteobacteria bacterium]